VEDLGPLQAARAAMTARAARREGGKAGGLMPET
jgi:hypothetical protein